MSTNSSPISVFQLGDQEEGTRSAAPLGTRQPVRSAGTHHSRQTRWASGFAKARPSNCCGRALDKTQELDAKLGVVERITPAFIWRITSSIAFSSDSNADRREAEKAREATLCIAQGLYHGGRPRRSPPAARASADRKTRGIRTLLGQPFHAFANRKAIWPRRSNISANSIAGRSQQLRPPVAAGPIADRAPASPTKPPTSGSVW